jgi:hypothetical protein
MWRVAMMFVGRQTTLAATTRVALLSSAHNLHSPRFRPAVPTANLCRLSACVFNIRPASHDFAQRASALLVINSALSSSLQVRSGGLLD